MHQLLAVQHAWEDTMNDTELFGRLFRASDLPSQDLSRAWHYTAAPSVNSFDCGVSTGKWCIFRGADEIDDAWNVVRRLPGTSRFSAQRCLRPWAEGTSTPMLSACTPMTV